MRSPAELRRAVEWALRLLMLAALAVAFARSLDDVTASASSRRADARTLRGTLAEVSRSPHVVALSIDVDSMPLPDERAWLTALRGAGVDVTWTGHPAPLAIQAARAREPAGQVRVSVIADSGAPVALADSAGALDRVTAARGATLSATAVVGAVRAARGRFLAHTRVPPATSPRAVLVLGRAGWEAKFVAAALQEAGWTVRSRQPVAPGVRVADAALLPLDTARYSAVVALDSTATDLAAPVARFVATGGGLVLAGNAAASPGFATLAPAQPSARQPARLLLDADSVTLASLAVRPPVALRADAIPLDATGTPPAIAVRRSGLGRVMTLGYEETWRWRMSGGASGPAAHRAWWSRIVGTVAPEPVDVPAGADAAPVAALVDALGPARAGVLVAPQSQSSGLAWYLLVIVVLSLLAETASRRFRGAS